MHSIDFYQVDAFTDKVFYGNPAAVCIMNDWLNDELMRAIVAENHLSETAFIIENEEGFHIRWFTPAGEIDLCGHATLAAGFVLFELQKTQEDQIHFHSLNGSLSVKKDSDKFILEFPRLEYKDSPEAESLTTLINKPVFEVYESELDYLLILGNEYDVASAHVDLEKLSLLAKRGLIISSVCSDADFYSRCFFPKLNINEDPVSGSAYCVLTPFWADRLNKTTLRAIQGSYRKGEIFCEIQKDSVFISGSCRWYLKGQLVI